MSDLQTLTQQALKLSPDDRALLAHHLWESLTPPPTMTDAEAVALALERNREMDKDPDRYSMTHEEVMKVARRAFP